MPSFACCFTVFPFNSISSVIEYIAMPTRKPPTAPTIFPIIGTSEPPNPPIYAPAAPAAQILPPDTAPSTATSITIFFTGTSS